MKTKAEIKQREKIYRENNKEMIAATKRAYHEKNKDKINKYHRDYRKKQKLKKLENEREEYYREYGRTGSGTTKITCSYKILQ